MKRSRFSLLGASKVSTKDIFLFQSAIPSHPLNFAGLSSFCNDVNAINEEFAGIPQVSGKIDELPPGAEVKNRYANVIPLPETRVQLQKLNNDATTEYINASYVRVRSFDQTLDPFGFEGLTFFPLLLFLILNFDLTSTLIT